MLAHEGRGIGVGPRTVKLAQVDVEVVGHLAEKAGDPSVGTTRPAKPLAREHREVARTDALEVDDEGAAKLLAVLLDEALDAGVVEGGGTGGHEPDVVGAQVVVGHGEDGVAQAVVTHSGGDGSDAVGVVGGSVVSGLRDRGVGVIGVRHVRGSVTLDSDLGLGGDIVGVHGVGHAGLGGTLGSGGLGCGAVLCAGTKAGDLVLEPTEVHVEGGSALPATSVVVHVVVVEVVPRAHGLAGLLGVEALVHAEPLGHGLLLLAALLAEQSAKTVLLRVLGVALGNRRLAHLDVIRRGVGGLIDNRILTGGVIETDGRRGAHGLGARVGEALGHLGLRGELLGDGLLGSERVDVCLQRIGQVEERGAASDVADGRVLLGGVGATAPLGVLDGTRTRALGTVGLGGLLVALLGHRGDAGVVVLHKRALVGALAILKLGERGRVGAERGIDARGGGYGSHGLGRTGVGHLIGRLFGDGLHGGRGGRVGPVSSIGGGVGGCGDIGSRDGGACPDVILNRLGLELDRLGGRGLLDLDGLGLRLKDLDHLHLGRNVGDVAARGKDAELADDLLAMARADNLLDDLAHDRLAAGGTDHGVVHGLGSLLLLLVLGRAVGLVAGRAHALHHAEHGGQRRLVVDAAGGVGQELRGDQRDAPGEDRKARDDAEDPEGAANARGKEDKDLDEGADRDGNDEVGSRLGDVLLGNGDLRTGEEVEALGVIVGDDHDGAVARGVLALRRVERDDVLAVGTRARLGNDVLAGVGHDEKGDGRGDEDKADKRQDGRADANEHDAQEQHGHDHAVGEVAQRRCSEILNLWFKPMGGKHASKRLGAVELLLATSRGNANLGIKILEEFLRNAHPVTFRIAAWPLPAVVEREYTSNSGFLCEGPNGGGMGGTHDTPRTAARPASLPTGEQNGRKITAEKPHNQGDAARGFPFSLAKATIRSGQISPLAVSVSDRSAAKNGRSAQGRNHGQKFAQEGCPARSPRPPEDWHRPQAHRGQEARLQRDAPSLLRRRGQLVLPQDLQA